MVRFFQVSGILDMGVMRGPATPPQSFALNHAFVDGNKRAAFAAAAVFLSVNGFRLQLGANDGEYFIVQKVIQDKVDLESIAEWLESHMRPRK